MDSIESSFSKPAIAASWPVLAAVDQRQVVEREGIVGSDFQRLRQHHARGGELAGVDVVGRLAHQLARLRLAFAVELETGAPVEIDERLRVVLRRERQAGSMRSASWSRALARSR